MNKKDEATINRAIAIIDKQWGGENATITDPTQAGTYIKLHLGPKEREHFGVLFLSSRYRVLEWEVLFLGDPEGCEVHPREVVKAALRYNAVAVIVGHNHPSGDAEPSAADRAVTARLKQALALVEVRLLDHFVVGNGLPVSLAARGWI